MALEEDISMLRKIELLGDFNSEQLRLIAFGSQKVEFPRNSVLFYDGQDTDSGYIVLQGEVNLVSYQTDDPVVVGTYGPGGLIGEMALITENKRRATAVATTDTQVFKIPRSVILRILAEYPQVAVALQKRVLASVKHILDDLKAVEPYFNPDQTQR